MSTDIVARQNNSVVGLSTAQDFVTVVLEGQSLGIPVLDVQDVLKEQKITNIPLAPVWVEGVLNLRGRIVTAIDMRRRLGLKAREDDAASMSVVVEHMGEPYSLQIDSVGEVLSLDDGDFEKSPVTLDPVWRDVSKGVYRLEKELLAILDVHKLLDLDNGSGSAAA